MDITVSLSLLVRPLGRGIDVDEISTLLGAYRLIRFPFIREALLIQSWLAWIYINLPVPLNIGATPPAA